MRDGGSAKVATMAPNEPSNLYTTTRATPRGNGEVKPHTTTKNAAAKTAAGTADAPAPSAMAKERSSARTASHAPRKTAPEKPWRPAWTASVGRRQYHCLNARKDAHDPSRKTQRNRTSHARAIWRRSIRHAGASIHQLDPARRAGNG